MLGYFVVVRALAYDLSYAVFQYGSHVDLTSYQCKAIGFVEELLDRTSTFKKITLNPRIEVRNADYDEVKRAIKFAEKYSLIAQSIKAEVKIEPEILIIN